MLGITGTSIHTTQSLLYTDTPSIYFSIVCSIYSSYTGHTVDSKARLDIARPGYHLPYTQVTIAIAIIAQSPYCREGGTCMSIQALTYRTVLSG